MPPQITVTREKILEAALNLVRKEGLAALSARAVAQQLGCSTQPVYRAYDSMEDLKQDLLEAANELAMSYLLSDEPPGLPFLQIGFGTLRFAQEEPELFKAVSLTSTILRDIKRGNPPPDFVLQRMRANPLLAPMADEKLTRIHALLWFFSQGLATLFLAETDDDPMSTAQSLLMQAGRAVISLELEE